MHAIFELLEAAEQYAAEQYSIGQLDEAVKFVADVQALTGAKSISAENDAIGRADRIMRAMALRMYKGDEEKARSFINGFAWSRTHDGADVRPGAYENLDAWEAGKAADPGRAKHEAAREIADAALRTKFGMGSPTTQKAMAYWTKQYRKAVES